MKKLFFDKTLIFFASLSFATLIFLFLSYNFFIKNYLEIENKENKKNIVTFFTLLNKNYKNIDNIKAVNFNDIKKLSSIIFDFSTIKSTNTLDNLDLETQIIYNNSFKNLKIYTKIEDNYIINYFNFYDTKNDFLFNLETKSNRALVKEGQTSLQIYITIVILFLILIFLITYVYQINIKKANDNLEDKVERRTNQINHTLKELEKVNLKLYDLAHTDHLTQIKNRRSFFMHAQALYKYAKKENDILSVIMIDIDNFKTFNDTYGHEVGDKILKEFTKTIKNSILEGTIFGRLGGEEFALIFPSTNLDDVFNKAEELRALVEALKIDVNNEPLKITASFGVSDINETKDIDEMIKNADKMLYHAKETGKNRVRRRL